MIKIISDEFVAKSKNSGSNNQEDEGIVTAPSVSASLNSEISTAPTPKMLKFSSTGGGKWENAVSSHFASVHDVWKHYGPFKKVRTRDKGGIEEYKCVSPTCAVQLRFSMNDNNRVDIIGEHNHAPISWKERLEEKNTALPPMVLSYVDSLIGQVRRRQLTPQDVCRMAEQQFCLDESLGINEDRDVRATFYRKIKNRVVYQRKKEDENDGPKLQVVYTIDLLNFKKEYGLCLPNDYCPRLVFGETQLVHWAKAIAKKSGSNVGIAHRPDVPHRNMVILPYPTVDEEQEMARVAALSSTRSQPAGANSVVFSSLALLRF
jgi:hypothetical protein